MDTAWPDSNTFWRDKRTVTGARGRRSTPIDLIVPAPLQIRQQTMIESQQGTR